jgi:hypothetical protein
MGMNWLRIILVGLTQTAHLTDGYFFVLAVVLQGVSFLRKGMAGFQLTLHAKQIFFAFRFGHTFQRFVIHFIEQY